MNPIQELAETVEKEASLRNHEVLVAVLMRDDLEKVCPYMRVKHHRNNLKKRIPKLDLRIKSRKRDEKLSLIELQDLKEALTKLFEEDTISLGNLRPCLQCVACICRKKT